MNLMNTVLNIHQVDPTPLQAKKVGVSAPPEHQKFGAFFMLALAALALCVSSKSLAQTAPPYVVYSQTALSGTNSPNAAASFGGFRGHPAINSRGDIFVSDGGGQHVYEYPANGGNAFLVFTDSVGNQYSGIAVDSADNLYIGVFTYNGPSGNNDQNSLLYEFPSTNGTYQGLPYVFNSTNPPGSCLPPVAATASTPAVLANTTVCSVGFYQGAIYYYWQGPFDTTVDGSGTIYTISGYTSHDNGDALTIQQCLLACAQQIVGNGASDYTGILSTSVQSIAANFKGDVFSADGKSVYIIPAGSPNTSNTPAVWDSSYNQPYGVSFDPSGNLYITDTVAIWEIPALEASGAPCKGGADVCTLTPSSKYVLIPAQTSAAGLYSSYLAPAIDNRGNIVFSPSYGALFKYSLWAGNFPAAKIGQTAGFGTSGQTTLNFTVSFDTATTLTGFTAMQGALPSTEFTVSPGSCTVGTAFAAKSTCSFSATFTPSGLGTRTADVLITDATGKTTSTFLTGVGTGTGVSVDPGTPTQIASAFKQVAGVAVDGAGNVYAADSAANKVQEFPVGGGAAVSIGTGLSVPTGVAVDGGGNVYIVNQGTGAAGGSVVEVPSVAGVLTNSAQKTIATGLNLPTDIVVDGNGNLYVSSTGGNQVLQLSNTSRDNASAAMISRGYGLSGPTGLALDPSGNLFVADTGNNRVMELGDGFQIAVGSGLTAPTGVATDPSGSVIIADGTGRIIRVPNESFGGANAVGLNPADQQVLSSPLSYPYSVRSDANGNLYISDNVAQVVEQLQRTTGTVNFGNWNLNTLSDAQTLVLSNIGTADLTIGSPVFAPVPAASEFAVTSGSGFTACSSGLFHSGYNCTVTATFDPTATGTVTYPLVFNAPAQNTAAPKVNLIGTGVSEAAATLKLIQVAPTTPTISYGQQIIISAKVSPSGSTPTPTGYVVFTFNGQPQRPIKLDSTGAASITFNGLNAGNNTLSAYYEGDTNYASLNSSVLPLVILQATSMNTLTVVGDSAVPLSVQPGDTITLTDVLTPAVVGSFTGTVNFIDIATNTPLNPTPIRVGSPDPKTGLYTVSYSFQPQTQFAGTKFVKDVPLTYSVVAVYSGNTNYFANTSVTIPYIVSNTTYFITANSSTTVTASANNPAVINLTVTDYSNLGANVALQCSGLPANAYCVFRPASAQLLHAPGALPNTVLTPVTIYPVPVTLQIEVDQSIIPIESSSVFWIAAVILGFAVAWRRKLATGRFSVGPLAGVLCILGLGALSGCGSSSGNAFPTPAGTYTVTITSTGTPLQADGTVPPCSYLNCNLPPDPVTNPSINIVRTIAVNLTVK